MQSVALQIDLIHGAEENNQEHHRDNSTQGEVDVLLQERAFVVRVAPGQLLRQAAHLPPIRTEDTDRKAHQRQDSLVEHIRHQIEEGLAHPAIAGEVGKEVHHAKRHSRRYREGKQQAGLQ